MSEFYKLNKYGAIDVAHIKEIEERIQKLENKINKVGQVVREETGRWVLPYDGDGNFYPPFPPIKDRVKKLEELTHANDYEYKTETKLIKKSKKENKND